MARRFLNGLVTGAGVVAIVGIAFAVAWAGDIFTIDKDGTLKFAVNDQGKITVGATESYVNLVIQNNAAVANNKVDVTADVLTVEGIRLETVNVAADLTLSGAGGLDTGSEAANTWYYVWVITNNNGTSSNGLLSTSSTAPTMPSGFTKKRRVGAVRNDASSNFLRFVQEGNMILYNDVVGTTRVLSGGTSTSYASVSAAGFVPPTSRRGLFRLNPGVTGTAGVNYVLRVRPIGSGSALGSGSVPCYAQAAGVQNAADADTSVILDNTQSFEYQMGTLPASGGAYIDVLGYYDRI